MNGSALVCLFVAAFCVTTLFVYAVIRSAVRDAGKDSDVR